MTLERVMRENGTNRLTLVECPVKSCGCDLRNSEASAHIANKHDPEDFGLSPVRGASA